MEYWSHLQTWLVLGHQYGRWWRASCFELQSLMRSAVLWLQHAMGTRHTPSDANRESFALSREQIPQCSAARHICRPRSISEDVNCSPFMLHSRLCCTCLRTSLVFDPKCGLPFRSARSSWLALVTGLFLKPRDSTSWVD